MWRGWLSGEGGGATKGTWELQRKNGPDGMV